MTFEAILTRLDCVKLRAPGRGLARCPGHSDRSPSLSIRKGERGVLIRCWAGCSLDEICAAIGLAPRDLFFDSVDTGPLKRRAAAQECDVRRKQREQDALKLARLVDACKRAERFLASRQPVDISLWSDERLDRELTLTCDALRILEADPYATV